jgi:transcriptional regulator with XRE-family HTH domain
MIYDIDYDVPSDRVLLDGGALRYARKSRNMTAKDLADAAKISHGQQSNIEQMKSAPLKSVAQRLADVLGVRMTDIKAKTRRKHQEPQEGPETTTSGPVDTEKIATAEPILLFTDADIEPEQQHDTKKALLTLWQDLDDVRQLHNVKVTMDAGGFAYGAYKATEYAQKRVAKAYKDITGEDLP